MCIVTDPCTETTDNAVPRQCFVCKKALQAHSCGHLCGHMNLDSKLSDNVSGIVVNIFNSVAMFRKKLASHSKRASKAFIGLLLVFVFQ